MDRAIADFAVPVVSLCAALIAVSFWRRLPDHSQESARAKAVDHGVLRLARTQLLGTTLEGTDLVIDAFGGSGDWTGYGGDEVLEEGQVAGTPMLTFRASFDRSIDLTALERLLAWTDASCYVDLTVDVDGDSPLKTPTRITITDHAQAVSLLTAVS
ncbi:MAG TPA: hypothetical protein VGO92_02335 [Acidimicrobiales bacterium]|jgi:hypothetical protein|nr:hypothetical protein [Acidimicrobiales bacterium]